MLIVAVVVVLFLAAAIVAIQAQRSGGGQARSFDVQVTGSSMRPDTLQANQGDMLTVVVSADKAEEIHLHGYDLKFMPEPGKPATKTFKADKSGSFEIEIEDTSTHLGELEVKP